MAQSSTVHTTLLRPSKSAIETVIVHNENDKWLDGSPQELLELTKKESLDSHVSLTSDKARPRTS